MAAFDYDTGWVGLMAYTKKLIVLLLSVMAAGCLHTAEIPEQNLEPLYGFEQTDQEWRFTVLSTGCSDPDDFKLHQRTTQGVLEIGLERVIPDRCKMAPHLISLPWQAVNHNKEIVLLNPIKDASNFVPGKLLER
jgi:hypothetical protein